MEPAAPEHRVHTLFETVAADFPEKTAVIFEDQATPYRQLNSQANQLARHLIDLGVDIGTPVGAHIERSYDLIVTVLAILKAGGVCVPLEPAYPAGRLAAMVNSTGLATIVTRSFLPDRFAPASTRFVHIDQIEFDSEAVENIKRDISADSPAFVLFTSGSSGEPKGVIRSHRSTTQHSKESITAIAAPHWMVLMRSAISHISFVFELVIPILARCPVVVARAGGERESCYLIQLIRRYHVTRIFLTPTMLRELVSEPDFAACTSLERVGASGEPLPPDLQQRFFAISSAALFTTYGCTEFPSAVRWQCRPQDIKNWYILGVPTPGTSFYLLDDDRAPAAPGEVGEIYLGGTRLADGYWGRPDLTARRFVANPFADQENPILYRTGDMARYREDGTLEYIGRAAEHGNGRQLNGQVQIRGFRVELGEIETVLDRHALVDQCAVIAVADRDWEEGRKIAAYFTATVHRPVTVNELRDHLARELPDYMLPTAFVRVDHFPMTPTGKIDRAALPDPDSSRPQQEEPFVAPRGLVEEQLAAIWQEQLGIDEIGVYDNFFVLGGQSLAAVRIVTRLSQLFDEEIPLSLLFDHPTIAGMAIAVEAMLL